MFKQGIVQQGFPKEIFLPNRVYGTLDPVEYDGQTRLFGETYGKHSTHFLMILVLSSTECYVGIK